MEANAFLMLRSNTGFQHPPFGYSDFATALEAAEEAVRKGYYEKDSDDLVGNGDRDKLLFGIGPGTIVWVVSREVHERHQQRLQRQAQALNAARQGLVGGIEEGVPGKFKIVVQAPTPIDVPYSFDTREAANEAAVEAMREGYISRETEPECHMIVFTGNGALLIVMSDESYQMQKRKALELLMQQALQRQGPKQGSRIIQGS